MCLRGISLGCPFNFLFSKPLLDKMSLLCRAFLPSARLHLFKSLTIFSYQFWEPARLGGPRNCRCLHPYTNIIPRIALDYIYSSIHITTFTLIHHLEPFVMQKCKPSNHHVTFVVQDLDTLPIIIGDYRVDVFDF